MMTLLASISTWVEHGAVVPEVAWSFALILAWGAGELVYRVFGIPRVSVYGLVGFLLAYPQAGLLPKIESGDAALLAHIGLGLILFELGYQINVRWMRTNPWVLVTGLLEAGATFAAVYVLITSWDDFPIITGLLIAALAMATSPAEILRGVNEQHSSGQVTERLLHLSALNCVLAVFVFEIALGVWSFQSSGSLVHAVWHSWVVLMASVALGAVFGFVLPALLRRLGDLTQDATVAFAISVVLLVTMTYTGNLSSVLATLTFGLVARHRRVALNHTQRNFGALGDLLTILLFVFVAANLESDQVMSSMTLAGALVGVRFLTKTVGVLVLARVSGMTWLKGLLTGVALMPMSVFAVLLLDQTQHLGIELPSDLTFLMGALLLLEIVGPIMTHLALVWAKETLE